MGMVETGSPAAGGTGGAAGPTEEFRGVRDVLLRHREAYEAAGFPAEFTPDGPTRSADPLLLYFTSGTTARPTLVEHTHLPYPVGHLAMMYRLGLRPGGTHLNISSPGWAKHAWSSLFAPWNAEATVVVHACGRFGATAFPERMEQVGVDSSCAPPTVWRMLVQAGPERLSAPKAYAVFADGREAGPETAREPFAHSRRRPAACKRVRRIEFAELPRTVSGKIRRTELRRRTAEESTTEHRERDIHE
ncbi:AMP-binding protein [Streptomyces sp. PLAI1-29]|uniref:AMP-binding protein n=1 Tax=Streptomyces zingiberis TaxID=2053010 RepID=A0ABX1CA93_9ACTN|nr:AMP-binding protein [Streptomyces zingiberis]